MVNKNKNNRIVFLTTLSVYLGLVLVGATPQILAQQAEIISQQTSIKQSEKTICSELEFAEIISLLNKYNGDLIPLKLSYQTDFLNNKRVNSHILVAEGNKLLVDFLRQRINCESANLKSSKKRAQEPISLEIIDVEKTIFDTFQITKAHSNLIADEQEVIYDVTYTFVNANTAKAFVDFFNAASNHARKIETPELISSNRLANAVFNNTTFRFENNQVFIVTRLPRGSLDELLKQNAKADVQ